MVDPGTRCEKEVTTVYQPDKSWGCCKPCRQRCKAQQNSNFSKPWSPWTLTQLSQAHNIRWQPFYYENEFKSSYGYIATVCSTLTAASHHVFHWVGESAASKATCKTFQFSSSKVHANYSGCARILSSNRTVK